MKLEEKSFGSRFISAIKLNSARLLPIIVFAGFSIYTFVRIGLFGLFPMCLSLLFFYPFIRIARDYIVEFESNGSSFQIKYLKYNKMFTTEVPITNCKFLDGLNANGKGVLASYIWLIRRNNGSTVIMQYTCADWSKEKLQQLLDYST